MSNLEKERFKCDQCEKYFTEDQMTTTGGDEIYCQNCYPDKVFEARFYKIAEAKLFLTWLSRNKGQ